MKQALLPLCLAAGFVASCASNPDTTRASMHVDAGSNEPPSSSLQGDPLPVAASSPADGGTPIRVPDYYVGLGARGLKGDALAAVLGAKVKLFDLDELTISTRPAVLFGGYDDEWSLPFTVDTKTASYGIAWFGGAGLRHGMDDLGKTDPMVTGGFDLPLDGRIVLNLTIDYMWQSAIDDIDGELLVSINYGF